MVIGHDEIISPIVKHKHQCQHEMSLAYFIPSRYWASKRENETNMHEC